MNSMSPLGSMMQGVQQGSAQASMLPSSFQPQGKAKARNIFQGTIDSLIDSLLSLSHSLKMQGDANRSEADEIIGMTYKLSKINTALDDRVNEEAE